MTAPSGAASANVRAAGSAMLTSGYSGVSTSVGTAPAPWPVTDPATKPMESLTPTAW